MTLDNFFGALFDTKFSGESINIRILYEQKKNSALNVIKPAHAAAQLLSDNKKKYTDNLLFPCVGINPYVENKKVSSYKNIVVDIDNAPLPEWAEQYADVICSRDELHHHLYFCFSPFGPNEKQRKLYSDTVKKLLKLTGSKEKAAHDPERVIRLPGFSHGKTGKPMPGYEIKFIRENIERISFKEKFNWLKQDFKIQIVSKTSIRAQIPGYEPTKPNDKTYANAVQYLKNLYLKKPALSAGDGRSRELFFIGLDAHAWGIPQEEAEALAEEINEQKFDPPEPQEIILHQIASAYQYRRGEFGSLQHTAQGQTERQQVRARLQFEAIQHARDLLAEFVYVHGAERLINTTTRFELTTITQINNYITAKLGEKVTLEELLKASAITCADELDFAPKEEIIFEHGGKTVFNRYTKGIEPRREKNFQKKAVKIFRDHVAYLTTSEAEETTLLQFLAFTAQNPGEKLKWAPLIISQHTGIGKSTLAELLMNILGSHNVGTAESDDLVGQHTDYVADKIFVVAHEVETSDKNVMRRLKSLITEEALRVVAKYARTYVTKNRANFIFFSNRVDAIRIDDNDRRLFVIYNRREPQTQEYYTMLYKAFSEGAGWILDYLLDIDLSGFNPHARPVRTEGREMLARASESELGTYLRETYLAKEGPFAKPIFTTRQLIDHIAFNAPKSASQYATQRAIGFWLRDRGFESYDYHDTVDNVRKHLSAWYKGSKDEFEKARKNVKKEVEHGGEF